MTAPTKRAGSGGSAWARGKGFFGVLKIGIFLTYENKPDLYEIEVIRILENQRDAL